MSTPVNSIDRLGAELVPEHRRKTLRAFIRAVLPSEPVRTRELEDRVLAHFTETLSYTPIPAELPFSIGLWALENFAWFIGPTRAPLSQLSDEDAVRYVGAWAHARVALLRDFFKAMKGFAMLAYYEQPEVVARIGYYPQDFIDELKAHDHVDRG